jgi:hypothetical protein
VYSVIRSFLPQTTGGAYLFIVKSGAEKLKTEKLKLEIETGVRGPLPNIWILPIKTQIGNN